MDFSERLVKRKLPPSLPHLLSEFTDPHELGSGRTFQPNRETAFPRTHVNVQLLLPAETPTPLLCYRQLKSHPPTENTRLAGGFSSHPLIYSFIQQIFGRDSLISIALDTRHTAWNKTDGVCVAMACRAQLEKEREANMCTQRLNYNTDACHGEMQVAVRV